MRIISKFHDYYDTVSTYGMDLTCIYKRKEIKFEDDTVEFKKIDKLLERYSGGDHRFYKHHYNYNNEDFRHYFCSFIFFCGKLYPFMVFTYKGKYFYYYDLESVNNDMMKYGSKQIKKDWLNKKGYFFTRNISKSRVSKIFNIKIPKNILEDLHHEYKSPILMYDGDYNRFVINPNLKKHMFYRVKDAYTAYQDISMFLSGVLGGTENKIIELSDKQRKEKHGFNEWSFRRLPSK